MICNVASYKFSDAPLKATYGSKNKVIGFLNPAKRRRYIRQAMKGLGMKRFEALFTRIR